MLPSFKFIGEGRVFLSKEGYSSGSGWKSYYSKFLNILTCLIITSLIFNMVYIDREWLIQNTNEKIKTDNQINEELSQLERSIIQNDFQSTMPMLSNIYQVLTIPQLNTDRIRSIENRLTNNNPVNILKLTNKVTEIDKLNFKEFMIQMKKITDPIEFLNRYTLSRSGPFIDYMGSMRHEIIESMIKNYQVIVRYHDYCLKQMGVLEMRFSKALEEIIRETNYMIIMGNEEDIKRIKHDQEIWIRFDILGPIVREIKSNLISFLNLCRKKIQCNDSLIFNRGITTHTQINDPGGWKYYKDYYSVYLDHLYAGKNLKESMIKNVLDKVLSSAVELTKYRIQCLKPYRMVNNVTSIDIRSERTGFLTKQLEEFKKIPELMERSMIPNLNDESIMLFNFIITHYVQLTDLKLSSGQLTRFEFRGSYLPIPEYIDRLITDEDSSRDRLYSLQIKGFELNIGYLERYFKIHSMYGYGQIGQNSLRNRLIGTEVIGHASKHLAGIMGRFYVGSKDKGQHREMRRVVSQVWAETCERIVKSGLLKIRMDKGGYHHRSELQSMYFAGTIPFKSSPYGLGYHGGTYRSHRPEPNVNPDIDQEIPYVSYDWNKYLSHGPHRVLGILYDYHYNTGYVHTKDGRNKGINASDTVKGAVLIQNIVFSIKRNTHRYPIIDTMVNDDLNILPPTNDENAYLHLRPIGLRGKIKHYWKSIVSDPMDTELHSQDDRLGITSILNETGTESDRSVKVEWLEYDQSTGNGFHD